MFCHKGQGLGLDDELQRARGLQECRYVLGWFPYPNLK